MPSSDRWSQWLAETRFGGDSKTADMLLRVLTQVRDHLLKTLVSKKARSFSMWVPARD
jgi:hypothetical protein